MPDIKNLTKTRLVLPLETGTVTILPGATAKVPRVTGDLMKAVEAGHVEVVGAARRQLKFPINDLLTHEAVATVKTLEDADLLRDLLEEAKGKKVREAIQERLKALEPAQPEPAPAATPPAATPADVPPAPEGGNDAAR